MLRRVQWAPISLAVSFCAWGFITGCEASGADLGNPLPIAQGGSSSAATGGVSNSNGGNTYLTQQGGQTATNQTGGAANTGQGGATGNGGNTSTGGATNTSSNTGGATTSATGGAKATGGATSTGNGGTTTSATGGATTTVSTGGATTTTTTGVGGATSTPTGNTVTFAAGKAIGAMLGYGFVALGSLDALTDPTCGAAKTAITNAAPCTTTTNWTGTGLCMTGSIPALPAAPVAADYSANWGVSVGVNATDPAGSGLGQTFTSVTITLSGVPAGLPTGSLRAMIHKKGDPDATSFCVQMTSGTAAAFTSFASECYVGAPATSPKFASADAANIDKISVQVSSGSTAITVTNLCITGITFS